MQTFKGWKNLWGAIHLLSSHLGWRMIKPWLGVGGLVAAGFLPCPECGAPLLWHFWPIAAVVAWRTWVKQRSKVEKNELSTDVFGSSFKLRIGNDSCAQKRPVNSGEGEDSA